MEVVSALVIEAWALRIASAMAVEMEFPVVVFESDCKNLINCINDPRKPCPWEIAALVDDIKDWAGARQWFFVWCCREKSKSAHWLASNCLNRKILIHTDCIPPGLGALLARESP